MGELNFLSNNSSDDKTPAAPAPKPESNGGGPAITDDKERIEKSREEVLEMIDKNKKDKNDKAKEAKNTNKSFLGGFFGGKNEKQEPVKEGTVPAPVKKETTKEQTTNLDNEAPKANLEASIDSPYKNSGKPIQDNGPLIFSGNSWTNSGVLETNLIDKNEYSFFDFERKFKLVMISILGTIVFVGALYFLLYVYEYYNFSVLENKKGIVERHERDVLAMEKRPEYSEAKQFQKHLDTAKSLLSNHVYWSSFFQLIEEVTIKDIYYTGGFSGTTDGLYTLKARTDSYESMKNQLIVFSQDERILSARTTEVDEYEEKEEQTNGGADGEETQTVAEVIKESGIEFTVEIEIDPEIFYNIITNESE